MRGRLTVTASAAHLDGLIPAGAGQACRRSGRGSTRWAHPRRCGADNLSSRSVIVITGSSPQVQGRPTRRSRACSSITAHPRRCGADQLDINTGFQGLGSSPQVRGRLSDERVLFGDLGLIPAGAGQTVHSHCCAVLSGAHPRRCGADGRNCSPRVAFAGSSPQVRGRQATHGAGAVTPGLIPAGAGQTCPATQSSGRSRAHPRRCGADLAMINAGTFPKGSSPQVRGRLAGDDNLRLSHGLVPAGAGQTTVNPFPSGLAGAHPRRCGADTRTSGDRSPDPGSSPQVRGRPGVSPRRAGRVGLIPANAGQTAQHQPSGQPSRAHPRRCGADLIASYTVPGLPGSSPQVRGRLGNLLRLRRPVRLIPAGAGQTFQISRSFSSSTGSSPQVRGRLRHAPGWKKAPGLIPAGAGQTSRVGIPTWLPGGSSPQVRGRLFPPVERGTRLRLIPAGAGQTTARR